MKYKRFINGLQSGGIKIIIIYSILSISLELIDYIILGKSITNNNFSGFSSKSIVVLVISLMLTAGLYGSSNDIIEEKLISFSTFLQNGKRYFFPTLGYTFLYAAAFLFVIIIPLMLFSYFISFDKFSFSNSPATFSSLITAVLTTSFFQVIFTPLIILNVIDKSAKGYLKKNYVTILIFSLIACSINIIPIVGKYFFIIIDGFYPLLIISMCDSVESTECHKNTIQDVSNNNL
jgi:hypothetical protein